MSDEINEILAGLGMTTGRSLFPEGNGDQWFHTWERRNSLVLRTLLSNYVKPQGLFRNSIPANSSDIRDLEISSMDNPFVTVTAVVKGSGKPVQKYYKTHIRFFRENANQPITLYTPMACKCSGPAFHYFLAHVLWKQNTLLFRIKNSAKPPPDIRNPKYIPTMCRHLQGLALHLLRTGVIKR